jgi:uncharacterized protein (TIGR03382 family)
LGDTEIEFGVVEEGVTWFADATLGGGPPDGFLKVHLVVVPPGASLDAGVALDGEVVDPDGGAGLPPMSEGGSQGGHHMQGPGIRTQDSSGCSVSETRGAGTEWPWIGWVAAAIARRRRGRTTV